MKKFVNALMLALLGWAMVAPAPVLADIYPNTFGNLPRRFRAPPVSALLPFGTTLVFFGNSTTDLANTNSKGTTQALVDYSNGYQTNIKRKIGDRVRISAVWNVGASGQDQPSNISYGLPALISSGLSPKLFIGNPGTNYVGGYDPAVVDNWDQMIQDAALSNPADKLLWFSILPRADESQTLRDARRAVNAKRAARAAANPTRVFYKDITATASAADDGASMNAGALYGTDGQKVHQTNYLGRLMGDALADYIVTLVAAPTGSIWGEAGGTYDASSNLYGNRLANPGFTGSAGTRANTAAATSTLPSNYAFTRFAADGATATTAIDAVVTNPLTGVMQWDMSGAGGGALFRATSSGNITTNQTAGMAMMVKVQIEAVNLVGISSISVGASAGSGGYSIDGANNTTIGYDAAVDGSWVRTAWVLVHPGVTTTLAGQNGVQLTAVSATASTTVSGSIKFSAIDFWQVPASIYDAAYPSDAYPGFEIGFDADATSGKTVSVSEVAVRYGASGRNLLDVQGGNVAGYTSAGSNTGTGNAPAWSTSSSSGSSSSGFDTMDGSTSTAWTSGSMSAGAYLRYVTQNLVRGDRVTITIPDATKAPTTMTFRASRAFGIIAGTPLWTATWDSNGGLTQTFVKP